MKRILPGFLTLIVMGVIAWAGLRRPFEREAPREKDVEFASPAEAQVHSLLRSAREGDVAAYLATFDRPLRARIEREIDEQGRDSFVAALRQAARSRKSRAVFAPVPEGDDLVSVVVESVYPDRNERQTYRLGQRPEGWLVTEVTTVRGHEPTSKFGSPASFQEPEGVPVPTNLFADENAFPGRSTP
jgi:hypothetical protein